MPSSGHRREHRRHRGEEKLRSRNAAAEPPRQYRGRSRDSSLSEEVSVSPSKSMNNVPSLPSRSEETYYTNASTTRSDMTLCIDQPSALAPSMRMSENDKKTTYQMKDGSLLTILDKASEGKSVSLKLVSGEQIFVERSDKGHSLMMLDRKSRVVHAVGTDWKEPESVFRA